MRSRGVDNVGVHLADQGRLTVKKQSCANQKRIITKVACTVIVTVEIRSKEQIVESRWNRSRC